MREGFKPNFKKFEKVFAQNAKWANLSVTISEIAKENRSLVEEMSKYDPNLTTPLLSGLLTVPQLQSNNIRIEILIALSLAYCTGTKKANINQVIEWFNQIGKTRCVLGEDPAEDVFVSLVISNKGDFRLLEGLWESTGFYTQRILEVVESMPNKGNYTEIKEKFITLLKLSDLICAKSNLKRYELGSDTKHPSITPSLIPGAKKLKSRVTFTIQELENCDINVQNLEPFISDTIDIQEFKSSVLGDSFLDHKPLIKVENTIIVSMPSSLSITARNYIIGKIFEGGLVDAFNKTLAQNYSKTFSSVPLLGGAIPPLMPWKEYDNFKLLYFHFKINEGYYISFHFYLPSLKIHEDGNFKDFHQDDGRLTGELQNSINEVTSHFEEEKEFKEGLILVVGCGWGKGHVTHEFELDHPKWRFQSISSADLFRLSQHHAINPQYLWKIQDGLETVNNAGVKILNINGLMNLVGWVQYNDGHIIPHSQLTNDNHTSDKQLVIYPPTNLLRDVRQEADKGYDRHSLQDNKGEWHTVQHQSAKPLFSSETSKKVYSSIDDIQEQKLTAVYEGKLNYWLTIVAPNIDSKETHYNLYKMGVEWLHRIGNSLDSFLPSFKGLNSIKIYIEFLDSDPIEESIEEINYELLSSFFSIKTIDELNACKLVFDEKFIFGFRNAENVAEQIFVLGVVKACLKLVDYEVTEEDLKRIIGQIIPNQDARSFHLIYTHNFLTYVQGSLPKKLILIDTINHASAKVGLASKALEGKDKTKIIGRKDCKKILNKLVDIIINEIIDELKEYNQLSILKRLILNNEKANFEENHWKRTSAAVLGLHSEEADTEKNYVEQLSKYAGAAVSSRVLIEIALCECPKKEGDKISDIELSKLLAKVSLVIQYGGISDAVHFNVLKPELTISPYGDVLYDNEFGHSVVYPMLTRATSERFKAEAHHKKRYYEEPKIVPETKSTIDKDFWEIWKEEMGFDLDEARNIIDQLESKGIQDQTPILLIQEREYYEIVNDVVSNESAKNFVSQFSLSRRSKWDKTPENFLRKEIYPWRFGRRLSFVTRPILRLDINDDPQLLIPPGALRKGFLYVFNGAYNGRLNQDFFKTEDMRNAWLVKANEGHTFNNQVENKLSEIGWNVRGNIGLPEILNRKTERDYGDIDVLAWNSKDNEVLIIECKDLSLARNYSEIASLLSEYQGKVKNEKRDKLRKHLDRVEVVQNSLEDLKSLTGINEPQIKSCLICNGTVPMQYSKIDALSETFVGNINDLVRS